MKKILFNKLVRDKIPDFLENKGTLVEKTVLSDDAVFDRALREKLAEESHEVRLADSKDALIEELADLQEVIDTLLLLNTIQKSEIELAQSKKRETKGGFEKRIFVSEITCEDENPMLLYYQRNKYNILEK
jgi:predicted house-cleaning noncanonical NTP pyrophosphatase (MazG superfamily)